MVSEVQVEDERMLQDIFKEDRRGLGGRGGGGYGGPGGRERWGDIYANTPVKKMIALYDYDPQEVCKWGFFLVFSDFLDFRYVIFSPLYLALSQCGLRGRVAIPNG